MPVIPKPVLIVKPVMKDLVAYFSFQLYYEPSGASVWTQENVEDIGDAMLSALGPKIKGVMSEEAQLVHLYVRMRTATQDLEHYVTAGAALGNGSIVGQCMPTETCLEIQRRTGKPGRNMRGRIFMSGLSEEGVTSGYIENPSDLITAAQHLASALAADVTHAAFTFHARHWNRKTNTLEVVTQARPVSPLVSRRDRRKPHNVQPF